MIRISRLLPSRLRTFLLALAEVGNDRNAELKLALIPKRRALFVDVGANRGQFARFMSSFYDRVIVFEPMEAFAEELNSILADNCTVYGFALADYAGPATFHVPESTGSIVTQTASLIEPSSSTGHNQVTVQVRRLDDFMLDDVSFIKVDIEGAEFQFLNGAIATIERCRPVLLIEIEDRHTGGIPDACSTFCRVWGTRPSSSASVVARAAPRRSAICCGARHMRAG